MLLQSNFMFPKVNLFCQEKVISKNDPQFNKEKQKKKIFQIKIPPEKPTEQLK